MQQHYQPPWQRFQGRSYQIRLIDWIWRSASCSRPKTSTPCSGFNLDRVGPQMTCFCYLLCIPDFSKVKFVFHFGFSGFVPFSVEASADAWHTCIEGCDARRLPCWRFLGSIGIIGSIFYGLCVILNFISQIYQITDTETIYCLRFWCRYNWNYWALPPVSDQDAFVSGSSWPF